MLLPRRERQEVFKPTLQYLKAEQFDAARTNTNYITRFINLKKKIDAFIVAANEVVDDVDQVRPFALPVLVHLSCMCQEPHVCKTRPREQVGSGGRNSESRP